MVNNNNVGIGKFFQPVFFCKFFQPVFFLCNLVSKKVKMSCANSEVSCLHILTPELVLLQGAIDPEEDLLLKYKDEDGDLITITDNSGISSNKY